MPESMIPRGTHQRLAFPPPPPRPSLSVWSGMGGVSDELSYALFLVARRARDLAVADRSLGSWKHGADIRRAAKGVPEIAADLLVLGADYSSNGTMGPPMALACHRVSQWARRQGYAELAKHLAEAASAIRPDDIQYAYEAGRINRVFGHPQDAYVFYGQAICLTHGRTSARSSDAEGIERIATPRPNGSEAPGKHQTKHADTWRLYVRAHLGLGQIYQEWGQNDRAAAHIFTAASAAWHKSRERWLAGLTQHDLFCLKVAMGDLRSACHHALRAVRWLPKHSEPIPALAHDASVLLIRHDMYSDAMSLLEATIQLEMPPMSKLLALSTLANAAGSLGRTERFCEARSQVESLIGRFEARSSAAYLNIAMGAHALGLYSDAEANAVQCLKIATARAEPEIIDLCKPVLATIQRREPPRRTPAAPPLSDLRTLTRELLERLDAWRGPTWRRKHQAGVRERGEV